MPGVFVALPAVCPGVLVGVLILGVFLYFTTYLVDSGVLGATILATLGVLTRRGELAHAGRTSCEVRERGGLCLLGTICHLSTGAGRGCFSRMSSFNCASIVRNSSKNVETADEFKLPGLEAFELRISKLIGQNGNQFGTDRIGAAPADEESRDKCLAQSVSRNSHAHPTIYWPEHRFLLY